MHNNSTATTIPFTVSLLLIVSTYLSLFVPLLYHQQGILSSPCAHLSTYLLHTLVLAVHRQASAAHTIYHLLLSWCIVCVHIVLCLCVLLLLLLCTCTRAYCACLSTWMRPYPPYLGVPASWVKQGFLLHALPPCPHTKGCSALCIAVHAVLVIQLLHLVIS